jgi:hypothetical protein
MPVQDSTSSRYPSTPRVGLAELNTDGCQAFSMAVRRASQSSSGTAPIGPTRLALCQSCIDRAAYTTNRARPARSQSVCFRLSSPKSRNRK